MHMYSIMYIHSTYIYMYIVIIHIWSIFTFSWWWPISSVYKYAHLLEMVGGAILMHDSLGTVESIFKEISVKE